MTPRQVHDARREVLFRLALAVILLEDATRAFGEVSLLDAEDPASTPAEKEKAMNNLSRLFKGLAKLAELFQGGDSALTQEKAEPLRDESRTALEAATQNRLKEYLQENGR